MSLPPPDLYSLSRAQSSEFKEGFEEDLRIQKLLFMLEHATQHNDTFGQTYAIGLLADELILRRGEGW